MLSDSPSTNKNLRQILRQRRRSLSRYQQQSASKQLAQRMLSLAAFKNAKKIGFYQACDGEVDLQYLLKLALQRRKSCYLPVLRRFPKQQLGFVKITGQSRLYRHRFGMKEPKFGQKYFIYQLDMVCMPLVGFDINGNRLGMGGGFYDRSLANPYKQAQLFKLGIAHDCQQLKALNTNHWDISLDAVLTPTHCWQYR